MPTKAVPTSPIPQYVSVKEVVTKANLPESGVRQWIREGRLRAIVSSRSGAPSQRE
jgi:hypothetical protein